MTAKSPLLEIPEPFDIIFHAPSDEFHLVKEGVAKMMIRRLFEDSNTMLTRDIREEWSYHYEVMTVCSEMPRCTNSINTSSMKGNELGLVLYSSFPVLAQILDRLESERWEHAKRAVALICFLVRIYNVEEHLYVEGRERVSSIRIGGAAGSFEKLHDLFYQDFMMSCCSE